MEATANKVTVKELISDNKIAKFSHYRNGLMYYSVETKEGAYTFPIDIRDTNDIGEATFNVEEKAIHLMRYINRSLKENTLEKIK